MCTYARGSAGGHARTHARDIPHTRASIMRWESKRCLPKITFEVIEMREFSRGQLFQSNGGGGHGNFAEEDVS